MNPTLLQRKQVPFLLLSLAVGLVVMALLSFKVFELGTGMSPGQMWDQIKTAPNYVSVLFVNALVGASVILFIIELRWNALRVALTVVVALAFGFLVTMIFNLDAADRFKMGEFKATIVTEASSPVDFGYGDKLSAEFNNPDTPEIKDITARFVGRKGDVITIFASAKDENSGLDMQVELRDVDGNVLADNQAATDEQRQAYKRDLKSPTDAIIENFALPADGFYAIFAWPADGSTVQAEGVVNLKSEAKSPVDFVYGDDKGGDFNNPKDPNPLTEKSLGFAGRKGDVVNLLAFVSKETSDLNLEIALLDSGGKMLAQAAGASEEQIKTFKRTLKSARDPVIEGFTLPADGMYALHIQPEAISRRVQWRETIDKTAFAYDKFLLGPLNRLNRWVDWIRDAITLIIVGLAIAIVFRAEQFSLGAEGQLYLGALASGVVTLTFGHDVSKWLLVPMALLSAATVGFLWGLLPGVLKAYLGANELVSTLMLNTIATRFYEMVITFQLKPPEAGYIKSDWIPPNGLLAPIVDVGGIQITIAVYVLIALVFLTWLLIQRTPIGYEIRMIGANRKFADYGGVNTKRTIMLAMAISGAVAGLAGAHLAMGVHRMLILNISLGLAFEGVVVALLARNNPLVVPFTGLLYAYLRTGARFMESDANISFEVVRIIQAIIILLITAEALVALFQRRRIRRRGTLELDVTPPGNAPTLPPTPATEEGAHAGD